MVLICFFSYLHTEVQCLNETQKYLRKIVHEIGLELRSTAVCKGVRRTRDGCFTLQDALTRNHWTASDIRGAIQQYHSTKKNKKKFSHSRNTDSRLQSEEFKITTSEESATNQEEAVHTVEQNQARGQCKDT